MSRFPDSVQQHALNHIAAHPGTYAHDDVPRSVLNQCYAHGWVSQDSERCWWLTGRGLELYQRNARRRASHGL